MVCIGSIRWLWKTLSRFSTHWCMTARWLQRRDCLLTRMDQASLSPLAATDVSLLGVRRLESPACHVPCARYLSLDSQILCSTPNLVRTIWVIRKETAKPFQIFFLAVSGIFNRLGWPVKLFIRWTVEVQIFLHGKGHLKEDICRGWTHYALFTCPAPELHSPLQGVTSHIK